MEENFDDRKISEWPCIRQIFTIQIFTTLKLIILIIITYYSAQHVDFKNIVGVCLWNLLQMKNYPTQVALEVSLCHYRGHQRLLWMFQKWRMMLQVSGHMGHGSLTSGTAFGLIDSMYIVMLTSHLLSIDYNIPGYLSAL